MATKITIGTCPACFRTFDIVEGRLRKHGWQEQGGREVGVYNKAWHSGECFGVAYEPFEISAEGTWAYLHQVVFPSALAAQNRMTYIATRPALSRVGRERVDGVWKDVIETLVSGDDGYDYSWGRETNMAAMAHEHWMRDGRNLCGRANAWVKKDLGFRIPANEIVHMNNVFGLAALCTRSAYRNTRDSKTKTTVLGDVTCSKCLAVHSKVQQENDVRNQEKAQIVADKASVMAYLGQAGNPMTSKAIKEACGLDTKRFNKLTGFSPTEPYISQTFGSGPTKYEVCTPRN